MEFVRSLAVYYLSLTKPQGFSVAYLQNLRILRDTTGMIFTAITVKFLLFIVGAFCFIAIIIGCVYMADQGVKNDLERAEREGWDYEE